MTRILLLTLLFMPTVLAAHFKLDLCGDGEEFVCIIRDVCKGDTNRNEMFVTEKGATNYQPDICDLHVMIKQYTESSYFIRFITKAKEIKLQEKDKPTYFGCELKNGKIHAIKSESIDISMISPEKHNGDEILCELRVTHTKGEEVFPSKEMQVVYNPNNVEKTMTIKDYIIQNTIKSQFASAPYKCDPSSIHYDDSKKFDEGVYSLRPLVPHTQDVRCPMKYAIVFEGSDGEIKDAESIKCEKDSSDNWKYSIAKKGNIKEDARDGMKAACRKKICRMCADPLVKCDGSNCKAPMFTKGAKEDECHTLKCESADNSGESIVMLGGGTEKEIGKFECTETEDEEKVPEWTFKKSGESRQQGKPLTTATCYDKIDCPEATLKCTESKECPKIANKSKNVTCPEGFEVEIMDDSSDESPFKPLGVQCDTKKGSYKYKKEEGDEREISENERITCSKKESAAASAGIPTWVVISIVGVIIFLILVIIFIFLCFRRKKKADEEKKALLKKNDSQQSSATESGKPQTGRALVQQQSMSTAKQTSSEQPSENTAKGKTEKEKEKILPKTPKTTIEPTLDLNTAYSTNKSKRSEGSIETELIHDGKRSQEREIPMEESAPSAKGSQVDSRVSKKEAKDEKKPRKFELNDKEKRIAKGVYRRNEDYPTMADIESDWDDAKDGKPPSKQRTATKDIPTADTPSNRVAKGVELNEKTAEMERLLDQPAIPTKVEKGTKENEEKADKDGDDSYSQASVKKASKKITKIMTTLDVTQDQQK